MGGKRIKARGENPYCITGQQGTKDHFVFVTAAVKRAGEWIEVRNEKSACFRLRVHHKAPARETWDLAYATDGTGEKAWL